MVLHDLIERFAIIIIPKRQIRVDLCLTQRRNQLGEVPVVSRLTVFEGEVSVDQETCRLCVALNRLSDDLTQVSRNGRRRGCGSFIREVQKIR